MELKTDKGLEKKIIKTSLEIAKAVVLGTGVYLIAKNCYFVDDIQACAAGATMGALAYILHRKK